MAEPGWQESAGLQTDESGWTFSTLTNGINSKHAVTHCGGMSLWGLMRAEVTVDHTSGQILLAQQETVRICWNETLEIFQ